MAGVSGLKSTHDHGFEAMCASATVPVGVILHHEVAFGKEERIEDNANT